MIINVSNTSFIFWMNAVRSVVHFRRTKAMLFMMAIRVLPALCCETLFISFSFSLLWESTLVVVAALFRFCLLVHFVEMYSCYTCESWLCVSNALNFTELIAIGCTLFILSLVVRKRNNKWEIFHTNPKITQLKFNQLTKPN